MGEKLFFSSSSMNCEYVRILDTKERIGDIWKFYSLAYRRHSFVNIGRLRLILFENLPLHVEKEKLEFNSFRVWIIMRKLCGIIFPY